MKTISHTKRMIAAAAILFTVIFSGCEKAAIMPANNNDGTATFNSAHRVSGSSPQGSQPQSIITDVTLVSDHIQKIVTTNSNRTVVQTQTYNYDGRNFGIYVCSNSLGTDTVVRSGWNQVRFWIQSDAAQLRSQSLFVNSTDRNLGGLSIGTLGSYVAFNHSHNLLTQANGSYRGLQTVQTKFTYSGNNVVGISNDFHKTTISYYTNLPYQPGINSISSDLAPIRYFKLLETANITSTVLYDKLIKKVTVVNSNGTTNTFDYSYTLNSKNQVTQIVETITQKTSTSIITSAFTHKITYITF